MACNRSRMKTEDVKPDWDTSILISQKLNLRRQSVLNVIDLLDDGATIPFIARYRKDQTDNMTPDTLREVASEVDELRAVESKIHNVHGAISKLGKMTEDLETSLIMSTSILEVESLYAPFKPGHKGSYAERARALGLGDMTTALLAGKTVNLASAVRPGEKGVESVGEVEKGVKHIVADIVSKDKEMMDVARELCNNLNVMLESSKAKAKAKNATKKDSKSTKGAIGPGKDNDSAANKFEQYFDFRVSVKSAKPYQILALNRGEDLNVLAVKVVIPDLVKQRFIDSCLQKLFRRIARPDFQSLIRMAVLDAYDRLIEPTLIRHTRSDLTKMAEKASISVFTSNLHRLLLTPPVKQKTILGIDPGFKNGCKFAVISSTGVILHTGVAYLHDYRSDKFEERYRLASVINTHRCETVAIGNGVACRETEQVVSDLIKHNSFQPLSVVYCIVDECGASIYSVSDEAVKEMPDLDPTLRGAVSIGRRLQDPLAELVKIDPKNLGVGMYQHDLNKTSLQTALGSVVEECVSFVGVDLNTCSECLLRRVAGLNATKAKKILEWRSKNGYFTSRQQLLTIKGLGKKGFEQCAGFVRITRHLGSEHGNGPKKEEVKEEVPTTAVTAKAGQKRKAGASATSGKKAKKEASLDWNPLDSTSVHPESYQLAEKLADHLGVSLPDIGTAAFIAQVKRAATNDGLQAFSETHEAGLSTVKLIADALQQPLSYDIRESFQRPIFKQEVMSVSDLRTGSIVTGRVTNVTHFGAFVDIGVGINGLVHTSKMGRFGKLGLGDHVEVKVENLDLNRKRIGLMLTNIQQR
ncbi:S1 RNA-binding domain-containing protein 1 [Aplysia californica]|uniref:S1 RNA-binding domain-containing protein 1 n=1 Tax=Aplysia californica TaxID=6500 RepID=A0ABM0JU18_APLCA|nr:S1 RNA-binding domain-containing protein 1 [Aplysia californica]XP_035826436.1 S1 RNA-binding domain-containing protein 1 [Aplysia californica]